MEDYYTRVIQIEEIIIEKAYLVDKNDNLLPRTTISKFSNFKEKQNVFLPKSKTHIYQKRILKRDHGYLETNKSRNVCFFSISQNYHQREIPKLKKYIAFIEIIAFEITNKRNTNPLEQLDNSAEEVFF